MQLIQKYKFVVSNFFLRIRALSRSLQTKLIFAFLWESLILRKHPSPPTPLPMGEVRKNLIPLLPLGEGVRG